MKVKVTQSCPTLWNPMDYTVHGILQVRILERVAFPFSKGSSQPRDQTQVSHIVGGFLLAEPQGKPKNTGVSRLSLLRGIFPTQGSNWDLLHCRWILYQLSHKGSPRILEWVAYPFFRRSSRSRNRTGVSCIAGRSSMAGVNRHLSIEAGEKVKVYDSSEKCLIYLTLS